MTDSCCVIKVYSRPTDRKRHRVENVQDREIRIYVEKLYYDIFYNVGT